MQRCGKGCPVAKPEMPEKPSYAPLPARAMTAEKLSALDFRVLMAIAAHDRFGANGTGCYASHTRLAQLVGCHLKSLSRSLLTLANAGFITGERHPLNGRLRVYRVRYIKADSLTLKAVRKGNNTATYEAPIGNETAPENGPIGNQHFENIEQNQNDADVNIFSETGIYPVETEERYTPEGAPLARRSALEWGAGKSVSAMLGIIERSIKAGAEGEHLNAFYTYLDGLVGTDCQLDSRSIEYRWAERLLITVGDKLERTAA